jgi:hypothetical protein
MKLPAYAIGGTLYPGKTKNGGWRDEVYTDLDTEANRGLVGESATCAGGDQRGRDCTGGAAAGE